MNDVDPSEVDAGSGPEQQENFNFHIGASLLIGGTVIVGIGYAGFQHFAPMFVIPIGAIA